MIIPILKSIRTLLSYVLAVSFIFSPFIPYGQYIGYVIAVFFLIQLPFIRKNDYCLNTWYIIDVLACHCVHRTKENRSISGWTGQHMHKFRRYYYQAKVIDLIFGEDHCEREFIKERDKGHVI